MKKWLLLGALVLAFPAQAQTRDVGRKIEPRSVPQSLARLMPRGARSLFWGLVATEGNSPIWVHLWQPTKSFISRPSGKHGWRHKLVLDFFAYQNEDQLGFDRSSSIDLTHDTILDPTWTKMELHILWLDPHWKKNPILKFDIWDPHGVYGDIGDNILAIFPLGLEKKAVVQSFAFGLWNASTISGQYSDFSSVDSSGLLQINTTIKGNGELGAGAHFVSQWRSGQFRVVKRRGESRLLQPVP